MFWRYDDTSVRVAIGNLRDDIQRQRDVAIALGKGNHELRQRLEVLEDKYNSLWSSARESVLKLESRHESLLDAVTKVAVSLKQQIRALDAHTAEHCQQLAELRHQVERHEVCHEEPAGD